MELTEEHIKLQELTITFIKNELNPNTDKWESEGEFPSREVFQKLGVLGLLGINKPEKYGGLGLEYSYQAVFAESLGYLSSTGIGLAISVQTDMATPALAKYGSDIVCEEFLRPTISGDRVAAIGVSEISGGSDLVNIKTTARKSGADFVINGNKMWITNGQKADWICLLANTTNFQTETKRVLPLDKSLICVPMNTPGISVSRKLNKLGMHSSDTVQIFFDEVRVPQKYLIGREGRGFSYQMKQFCDERLFVCLGTIISMRDTIEQTIEYTADRRAFGKPILNNQSVQFGLADLLSEVEVLRAFAWKTVEDYVSKQDIGLQSAILKLRTGRLARKVNDQCLQLWGGMGYMDDSIVARRYRDQRLISIGGGTDEMMLQIIGGYLNFGEKSATPD